MRQTLLPFWLLFLLAAPLMLHAQDKDRLHKQLKQLETLPDDTTKALALNEIGWDTSYDNLSAGLKYAEQSLNLSKQLGYSYGMMMAWNTIGTIYDDMGEYTKALDAHHQSLQIAERDGVINSQATSWMNMALVYRTLGQYDKSYECLLRAKTFYEKTNAKKGLCAVYTNLGSVYLSMDSVDLAIGAFNTAYGYARGLKNKNFEGAVIGGLASCFMAKNDSATARQYLERTIVIFDSLHDNYDLAASQASYGKFYTQFHRYEAAEQKYLEALRLYREIGVTDQEKNTWQSLAELYEKMGDEPKTLDALKKFTTLKDSLISEKVLRHQRDLEAVYENEKKENEIRRLKEDETLQRTYVTGLVTGAALLLIILLVLYNRNQIRKRSNQTLAQQHTIIEEKNKNITDSINYARRIQDAVLPPVELLKKQFADAFTFYQPRDIVSGDFWWMTESDDGFYVAMADCTGHGVPGGFMSVMGAALLTGIVNGQGVTEPAEILTLLRQKVIDALQHEGDDLRSVKDGMDIVVCRFNREKTMLRFACANNPLWIVRDGQLIESTVDKFPAGAFEVPLRPFTPQEISLQKGDAIYLFTDGFADQFGGAQIHPAGKKFTVRQLQSLLTSISALPMPEQQERLTQTFLQWKGGLLQTDDVCALGIRI